jgi:TolB-like protein/Tfp pilus assembly protein PilF
VVRFGLFVFDPHSGDLRKQGRKIRLEGQPVQILVKLLERPGELVTREELQKELWPADIYVNYDHGLNAAVKRLRRALNDSPARPVFIETLSRRGYRFIAPVTATGHPNSYTQLPPRVTDLAVLPFEDLSGDPSVEYLGEGIAEAVIHALSQLPAVRVMARSAAFRFKGANLDPQAIGRKLNVRAILVGRVWLRGDSLTIGAELVDVRNGWQIWGGQYNRKLSQIQTVEEEMTRDMCDSLRLRLNGEEGGRVFRHFTENTEAYQEYLKGRFHWNRLSEASVRRSIECYQNAISQDPNYALAFAGLADSYALLGFFGVERPANLFPKAKQAALQALTLDERLPEAHCALAGILKIYEWDWQGAERAYEQALRLDPKNWQAHRGYAALLAARGRTNAAMREIQSAHELDPLSLSLSMEIAWNLYIARRYDDAIRQAARTLEMEPTASPPPRCNTESRSPCRESESHHWLDPEAWFETRSVSASCATR